MNDDEIVDEYVPILRRVLAASPDANLRAVGERGKIMYLVQDDITSTDLDLWNELIANAKARIRSGPASGWEKVRESVAPYLGKQLLRTGMWLSGQRYDMYLDPVGLVVVHSCCSPMADPDGPSLDQRAQVLAGGGPGLFSRDELSRQEQALRQLDLVPVETVRIDYFRSESQAVIQHADKSLYYSLSHFWLNSQRTDESLFHVGAESALCQPLTEEEFLRLLEKCLESSLFEATLRSLGKFAFGQWMANEWDEESAVAKIGENYFAAYWLTFA